MTAPKGPTGQVNTMRLGHKVIVLSSRFVAAIMLLSCVVRADPTTPFQSGVAQVDADHYRPPLPESLTLDIARQYALDTNPSLAAAAHRIEAATAVYKQARSSYLPTLTASASAIHTHDTPMSQLFVGVEPYDSFTISAGLNWLIFDGFARQGAVLAAREGEAMEENALADGRRLLLRAVSTAFHSALLASENLGIAREDAAFNAGLAAEERARLTAGRGSRSEVLNFDVRVGEAEDQVLVWDQQLEIARTALATLMAAPLARLPEATVLALPTPTGDAAKVPELEAELAHAMALRPDLSRQERAVQQAEALVAVAKGECWPTVMLTAEYGESRRDNPRFDDRADALSSVGVFLAWDFFTGGSRQLAVEEARALVAASERELDAARYQVLGEVRQEYQNLMTAVKRLGKREDIHAKTLETRELVAAEYRAGKQTVTRVNEVQQDVVSASGRLALARIRVIQARENLDAATGRNLEPVGTTP